MVAKTLVDEQIDAGSRFLFEFQKKYRPLLAALWLKKSDETREHLYIASEKITDENFDVAYGEVGNVADELQDPLFLSPFRVKLIFPDDPLVEAAKLASKPSPYYSGGRRFFDTMFGGVSADEVYVYPLPIAAPAGSNKD